MPIDLSNGLEGLDHNFLTGKLEDLVKWSRSMSNWPATFGLACCAPEMMEPKWVISMGVCASTGGMFNNYAIVQGVDQIVPVDVYAPGCPPGPETLMHSILTLHELIRAGELTRRRQATGAGAQVSVEQRDGQTAPTPTSQSVVVRPGSG